MEVKYFLDHTIATTNIYVVDESLKCLFEGSAFKLREQESKYEWLMKKFVGSVGTCDGTLYIVVYNYEI